jgi:quinol monooxygenase YgiN
MSNLTVIAKVVAKKGSVERVRAELLKLIEPTRKENGCLEYTLHRDNDDPAIFLFYETWQSRDSLSAHMESEHFKSYVNAVDGLLAGKAVHLMTRIG